MYEVKEDCNHKIHEVKENNLMIVILTHEMQENFYNSNLKLPFNTFSPDLNTLIEVLAANLTHFKTSNRKTIAFMFAD